MDKMFYNCTSIDKLDLSEFNTLKVTSAESMLSECYTPNIYIGNNWDLTELETGYTGGFIKK